MVSTKIMSGVFSLIFPAATAPGLFRSKAKTRTVVCTQLDPRQAAARGIAGFTKMLTIQEKISPLRRVNTIEEIGDAAMFLCSDLSRGITSEVIHVDCGFSNVGVGFL